MMNGPDSEEQGRSIFDLLRKLGDDTATLLRQEVALAKTEMSEKVSDLSCNAVYLATGGVVLFAGFLFILLAINILIITGLVVGFGLPPEWANWLGPLILGIGVSLIGYGLIRKTINTIKNESVVPKETIQSFQETKEWAREKIQ